MKRLACILLITASAACSVKLMNPSQSDVDRVSAKYPGYSLTELNQGKALFEQTCNRCHKLKNPVSRSETKWEQIVPRMVGKLNRKEGRTMIDDNQQGQILKYLVTMSGAPKGGQ